MMDEVDEMNLRKIEALRAQVAELEAERNRWKADYLEQVDKHNVTLDELRGLDEARKT